MSRIEISGGASKEALEYGNLDHLALTACADVTDPVDMTAEVADNTVLANILSNDGNTSDYDRSTDSLEAISDRITIIDTVADAILADTAAMLVLTESGGTLTTDGNEQSVYVNETPAAAFKPICVKIDCTAHTATESITIKLYYRIKSGGEYILQDTISYTLTTIVPALLSVDLEPNRYGVKVTMQKTAGTNRAYDWEACYEV